MTRTLITSFTIFLFLSFTKALAQNVTVNYVAFYEHLEGSSKLRNTFLKQEATHIGTYFKLTNDLYNKRDNPIDIMLDYYYGDGRVFGSTNIETTIPKTKSATYVSRSFGFNKVGTWAIGKYYVIASIKGHEIASASFYITNGKVVRDITEMKFFEGGSKIPEKKIFIERFAKTNTRIVYTHFNFVNPNYNRADFTTDFTLKYFKPDGSLLASPKLEMQISKKWSSANAWKGYGYVEAKNSWIPGNYRVEVWAGDTVLKTGYFTVY